MRHVPVALVLFCLFILSPAAQAQQDFGKLVGPAQVGPVQSGRTLTVPFITWGGDVATFHANGGLKTKSGTIFAGHGLDLSLKAGDDFVGQVRDYMSGKTPFLRGTLRMLAMASGVLGSDPRTQPVVILQMTWSAGDHMVSRDHVRTLDQLKGKKVVMQRGGPHVGMVDDVLRTAGLSWSDINVIWVDDLTGDNGPAARFRKDKSIDACCVITPDMFGLTGGPDATGTGAEGTVKGARVLVSTTNMKRSIADVYAVRKDWFDSNRATVEKFVAGYLKASEEMLAMRARYEAGGDAAYMKVLKMTQQIYGEDVIPTLEIDAHGLIADCRYVGLPGNRAFFELQNNDNGFERKQAKALDMAVGQRYASSRRPFLAPSFDYARLTSIGKLTSAGESSGGSASAEVDIEFDPTMELDDQTIYAFTISFEPNQNTFPASRYGADFKRALEGANLFGNSLIVVRGHSDPIKTLSQLVRAGLEKGILKQSGSPGNYRYFFKGAPLDITNTSEIVRLIESGSFDGSKYNPRETMQAALNLSRTRAEAVRDALIAYASSQQIELNEKQFRPVGAGITEPLIAKPRNLDEAKQNMRVEFRIIKVEAEAVSPGDFDF